MDNLGEKDLKFLQNTVMEDNEMFNRIRTSIKQTGDMFLLGKPSEQILNLILKLYHENILRLLLLNDNAETKDIKMMLGIMELKNGEIYITLSEDPREDPLYEKKTKMLASLLNQTNVELLYPERDLGTSPTNTSSTGEKDINARLKNKINGVPNSLLFPDLKYSWRLDTKSNGNVITAAKLQDYAKVMFLNEDDMVRGATATYNYDHSIWSQPLTVNLIHSLQYLNERKENGISFIPFKKVKTVNNNSILNYECNNGSTCSESKLFSYLYTNLGLTFADIKGYAAYWIDNKLPPNHIIPGYCFASTNAAENKRLEELTDATLKLLNDQIYEDFITLYHLKFRNVFKSVVQPFALPCPGCFANYLDYKTNKRSKWDNSQCIPYSSRTRQYPDLTASTGGKAVAASSTALKHTRKLYSKNKSRCRRRRLKISKTKTKTKIRRQAKKF
jgi:hypothetical protein